MAIADINWTVGRENSRESVRFRFPLVADKSAWPWVAMFEKESDAALVAHRVAEYKPLVEENQTLRKRVAELEAEIAAVQTAV